MGYAAVSHDPGDEHQPVFATGMTAEHPATPPVFHVAHERIAPLDDVSSRVLLVSHAYRRASADPANATLWLAVAREATGLANALDARG